MAEPAWLKIGIYRGGIVPVNYQRLLAPAYQSTGRFIYFVQVLRMI